MTPARRRPPDQTLVTYSADVGSPSEAALRMLALHDPTQPDDSTAATTGLGLPAHPEPYADPLLAPPAGRSATATAMT